MVEWKKHIVQTNLKNDTRNINIMDHAALAYYLPVLITLNKTKTIWMLCEDTCRIPLDLIILENE